MLNQSGQSVKVCQSVHDSDVADQQLFQDHQHAPSGSRIVDMDIGQDFGLLPEEL